MSPNSEKAYKEITSQFEKWIDAKSSSRQQMHHEAGPGPGSEAAEGGSGGKRFKSLSIMVPASQSQPILQSTAVVAPSSEAPGQVSDDLRERRPSDIAGLNGRRVSDSGGLHSGGFDFSNQMGMSLPSPSTMLFGLGSDGLFTSRGTLHLGLDSPGGGGHGLTQMQQSGDLHRWPSSSMASPKPGEGFSDDGESGEELQGDVMMVTGRGIQPATVRNTEGPLGVGEGTAAGTGSGSGGGPNDSEMLVVSGTKLDTAAAAGDRADGGAVEFPGFASGSEAARKAAAAPSPAPGIISDIPLDI